MMFATTDCGRHYGCRGLAAEPGPRKYEALFRENDIDETVLPTLTAEDLKELGVASFGHRRKLLDAIAALRNDASGKAPPIDAATASKHPKPSSRRPRRAPSSHGDVLRLGRLYGLSGPRGP
jgi:SAM domain (Sterile alpha motif)